MVFLQRANISSPKLLLEMYFMMDPDLFVWLTVLLLRADRREPVALQMNRILPSMAFEAAGSPITS